MKKQWLIGAAAAALIAGLAGGYGILGNKGAQGMEAFNKKLTEKSNGTITLNIYPSGQLGDDARCYQSMEMGALDLYRGNSMSLVDSGNPMMSALVLPYVFRDREHFWKVCSSDLGREILDNIQDCTGMIGLAYLDE